MQPSILFAAIALFSQIGGIEAQEECQMNTPSRLDISANNTFEVTVTYPYKFSCDITVEDAYANDGKVYGATSCVNFNCKTFDMKSPLCTADYVVKPQCVGYNEKCIAHPTRSQPFSLSSIPIKGCPPGLVYACSGNVCENGQISNGTGPGCYCPNNAYLNQRNGTCLDRTDSQCQIPATSQSVNLFVQPCVEANKIMAITWNPQSYRIVRLEVRDSTGDLVVTRPDIVNTPNTPFSVFITAPPVGIYEVTVFGEDRGEGEIRNFNESAMFITKQDNAPHQFRVTALPINGGVSVCFSSANKDVSYLCQDDSGTKMSCTDHDCVSYSRDNGTGKITIYTQDNVIVDSFQYRV